MWLNYRKSQEAGNHKIQNEEDWWIKKDELSGYLLYFLSLDWLSWIFHSLHCDTWYFTLPWCWWGQWWAAWKPSHLHPSSVWSSLQSSPSASTADGRTAWRSGGGRRKKTKVWSLRRNKKLTVYHNSAQYFSFTPEFPVYILICQLNLLETNSTKSRTVPSVLTRNQTVSQTDAFQHEYKVILNIPVLQAEKQTKLASYWSPGQSLAKPANPVRERKWIKKTFKDNKGEKPEVMGHWVK